MVAMRRYAARVRAGFVLFLVGEGLRIYSRRLPGAIPAPLALAGTIGLVLAVAMIWTGLEGFMRCSENGFELLGGDSPPDGEAPG